MVEFHFFLHVPVQLSHIIYWGDYFYSIVCLCPLCEILIDHRDMSLFLVSLFCSTFVCSYASIRLFWLPRTCNIVWCQVLWSLLLCSFFSNCCGHSGLFMVPYKFLKCLFYICEMCHWCFDTGCTESRLLRVVWTF